MRKWLHAWGPTLAGGAIATGAGTGAVALGLAHCFVALVPCVAVALVATLATLIGDIGEGGPARRRDKAPCSACYVAGLRLGEVTKDRDELREALTTLSLDGVPDPSGKAR